jgi:hypothetical protein
MYDIDSNGSVDRQEMLKIIEVRLNSLFFSAKKKFDLSIYSQSMIYSVLVSRKIHQMVVFQIVIQMTHRKIERHKYLLLW